MLAGSRAFVDAATRYRRMAGGAMRQVGIFAAAAEHALDHHLERLADDHANARLLADRLAASPAIELDPTAVQTNIVVFRMADGAPDAPAVVARRPRGRRPGRRVQCAHDPGGHPPRRDPRARSPRRRSASSQPPSRRAPV